MARLRLTLLGGFQARRASGEPLTVPGKKAQALLAYLALRPGQPQPRPKLAALLWGDRGEAQARDSLRQTLVALRRALPAAPPPSLIIEPATLALNPAAVEVDVAVFERWLAEGTPKALEQAAALYQGDLLEGLDVQEVPFEEWLRAERERLRERARKALAQLLVQQSQPGMSEPAIHTAARLLALDPLQEPVHRTLMRLYAREGRWAAALKQYQLCLGVLQRELGVEPEPETRQLYQEILQQRACRPPRPEARAATARRAEAPGARAQPASRAHETALIGRDPELGALRQAMAASWQGQGRVAAVVGEAGIGKTRLVEELAAEWLERGGEVLLGRAYDLEQILPFRSWVDALRGGQVLREEAILEGLGPAWRAELARLFPELGAPGSQLPTAPQDHLRLFEAVSRLLERLAARWPFLVVLEDLHWADEMSVRLLAFIARRMRGRPLLLVGTVREEELPGAALLGRLFDELGREPGFVRLALSPLSQPDTARLVRALAARAGGEEAELVRLAERIWRASEGNPFMVVETLRALQQAMPPETPGALPLPGRVRQVIAGRLERLTPRARDLVAVAAVVGREFDFDLLQQAAGLGDREAAEALEELVRRHIVHGVGERLDFTHDLIRAVAYDQLAPPQRKLLHRVVATTLERSCGPDTTGHDLAIGTHYRHAEVWDKACTYLSRAGAQAWSRWALVEAVTCREHALAALEKLPRTDETIARGIDLRMGIQNCFAYLDQCERQLPYLRDAEALASRLGDRRRLTLVVSALCHAYRRLARHADAIREGERALALIAESSDPLIEAEVQLQVGNEYLELGDYRRARSHLLRSLAAHEEDRIAGGPDVSSGGRFVILARARYWLTLALAELGHFAEGVAQVAAALRDVEGTEQSYHIMSAHVAAARLYLTRGDIDRAVPHLESALAQIRRIDSRYLPYLPVVGADLAYAYALAGRPREAQELLDSALAEHSPPWRPPIQFRWLARYAPETALLLGRADQATVLTGHALEYARTYGERAFEAAALRLRGWLSASRTPPEVHAAESSYGEALALAEELGMRPLVAHCHLGLGRLYSRTGEEARGQEHLTTAARMYGEMDMGFWLAQAEAAGGGRRSR